MLALTLLIWRVVNRSMIPADPYQGGYQGGYYPAYAEEPQVYGYGSQDTYAERPRERLQRPRRPDTPGDVPGA